MLPLFFQVVLLDSATKAGARLAIPSLATPIGGVIAGVIMSQWGKLLTLSQSRRFLSYTRQCTRDILVVLRQHVEVSCFHLRCQFGPGNHLS